MSGAGVTMGAPTASPCGTCDARCCSAYAVHVTGDDVRRLADGTGIPPHAFLWCQPQAARTATGFLLEPGGPSYDLVLAPPRSAEVRPPCAFLSAGDGPPRCGAYRFRPRVCRRFPAVRREGGYGVRDGIVCPPGAWDGRDMARLSWRVALEREEREAHAYAAVVTVWNARVARAGAATFPRYLDWLTDAYGWLVRWRAALRPAERAGAAYLERIRRTLASCPAR